MLASDLENRFSYHPPESEVVKILHEDIRGLHLNVAQFLNAELPQSRELSTAITKLEESMMWANAALARHRQDQGGAWVRK